MSWSRILAGVAALALAGGVSGCFQPLYGEASHPGLVEDLRAIEVAPINDRVGHFLAEDLIADLNGTGQTPPPKYHLKVTISLGTQTPTVNSEINAASSATLTGDATFTLTRVDGGDTGSDRRRHRRRGLRPHDPALCRPSRGARRRDSRRPRAVLGDFPAPGFGAGGQKLIEPTRGALSRLRPKP